jgi:hypothetical protein
MRSTTPARRLHAAHSVAPHTDLQAIGRTLSSRRRQAVTPLTATAQDEVRRLVAARAQKEIGVHLTPTLHNLADVDPAGR